MKYAFEVRKCELSMKRASLYAECALLDYSIGLDSGVITESSAADTFKSVIQKVVSAIKSMFKSIIDLIKSTIAKVQAKLFSQKLKSLEKYSTSSEEVIVVHPSVAQTVFDSYEVALAKARDKHKSGLQLTPQDLAALDACKEAAKLKGKRVACTVGQVICILLAAGGIATTLGAAAGVVGGFSAIGGAVTTTKAAVDAGVAGASAFSAIPTAVSTTVGASQTAVGTIGSVITNQILPSLGNAAVGVGTTVIAPKQIPKLANISRELQDSARNDAQTALIIAQYQCDYEKAKAMYLAEAISLCGRAVKA